MKTSIIVILNNKGGVGKTTTSINLASSYAELGKKVLVIDLDSQANATAALGMAKEIEKSGRCIERSVLDRKDLSQTFVTTKFENIDGVGVGSRKLMEKVGRDMYGSSRHHKIIEQLLECKKAREYDLIIIDSHPGNDDVFLQSALAYAHYYLIPLFAEEYSSQGLVEQINAIEEIRLDLNPMLTFLGAVITKFDKYNSVHVDFEEVIRDIAKKSGFKVMDTVIPNSKLVSKAESRKLPLNQFGLSKNKPVTHAYTVLAGELLPNLKGRRIGRKAKIDTSKITPEVGIELSPTL